MPDYDRRLKQLESRTAATVDDDKLLEAIRKRMAELLSPEEIIAVQAEIDSDPEWRAQREENSSTVCGGPGLSTLMEFLSSVG